jgi:hypothetical protein
MSSRFVSAVNKNGVDIFSKCVICNFKFVIEFHVHLLHI